MDRTTTEARAVVRSVYLLGPDLRTLGGYESQITLLAAGLRERGVAVSLFIAEPVAQDHPYWRRAQAAGVRTYAPSKLQATLWALPQRLFPVVYGLARVLLAPGLAAAAAASALVQRRPFRRAWQGATGQLHGALARLAALDGATRWLGRALDSAARSEPPDVVDVQHSYLPQGLQLAGERGWVAIYTEHGAPTETARSLWIGLAPVIHHARLLVGRAQASLDGLRLVCGATQAGVVVPQAVMTQPTEAEVAQSAAPKPPPVVIGMISRLAPEKGADVLLWALERLTIMGLHVEALLAGDGPQRPLLEAEAQTRGLGGRIEFLGAVPNEQVPALLRRTHIVAHPSLTDSRPMAVLEAMAWGRPVVASRVGGIPELVDDGVTGRLVPAGDAGQLAEALASLARDPAAREAMGRAARQKFVAGGYSPESMVAATLDAYARAVAAHAADNAQG